MTRETTVQAALHDLMTTATEVHDDLPTRASLAAVVTALEQAAGVPLGRATEEPLVVLQRRLGRAHRLLAAGAVTEQAIRGHAASLRQVPAGLGRASTRTVAGAVPDVQARPPVLAGRS